MTKLSSVTAVGLTLSLVLFGAAPSALADNDVSDLEQLLGDSAPTLIDETDDSIAPDIATTGSEIEVTALDEGALDVPSDAELIAPPTFTVDFADGVKHTSADGIVEFSMKDGDSSAFMQPISGGFRILTSTTSQDGPSSFDYSLDVPSDSRLVEMGEHLFIKSGDQTVGIIDHPWAKDSKAADVPTWYTLSDSVLTQHLDLSGVDAYPVVADPAWSYTLVYNTNKSTYAVANLLGSCFNCFFPLTGAPRAWPKINQYLPLFVGPKPFPVTMATVSSNSSYTWFQFSFYAAAGHPDGPGSAISFTFENQKLYVYAWITNDFGAGNIAYKQLASLSWSEFATRLRNA